MIKKRIISIQNYYIKYIFILPAIIFMLVFLIYPLCQSIFYSFFNWDGVNPAIFTGISNYLKMFKDSIFQISLKNSLIFMAINTAGTILMGLFLALCIDLKLKGWQAYRTMFFLPIMISTVITALLWTRILDPINGPLNIFLRLIKLDIIAKLWIGDSKLALYCIIAVSIWQFSGFPMVFFLTAMKNIPEELYDAAKIDGAGIISRFFYITLPLIRYVLAVIAILQLIWSFQIFDMVWAMTRGGPGNSSQVLGTYLYLVGMRYMKFGYASVIAAISLIISLIFSIFYLRYSRYRE